ncbi:putative aspartic proteinase GIP2 [Silene latifolia]|uniref:putative aspartic proteinase GIP2 n=1 Tax=Silene latifolia TaxID=37657 RepID=UPI003D76B110
MSLQMFSRNGKRPVKKFASFPEDFCYDCDFPTCLLAKGQTCGAEPYGPYLYTHDDVFGHFIAPLITDVVTIYKSSMSTLVKTQLSNFPFACGYISELKGLSQFTKGVLSLARKNTALPSLVAKTFNVPRKFALCLPSTSSTGVNGAIYFGGGPYSLPPNKNDLSKSFVTTPLVVNSIDVGVTFYREKSSVDYFINVKSILVDGPPIKIDSSLLTIDKNGTGGTKLSTINGYTILHTAIYNTLVQAFSAKAAVMNSTKVGPVSAFGTCFSSKNIAGSKTGPKVPVIDLVLDGNSKWSIYGYNSMVKVSNDVRCLGFLDGGNNVKTSIVIGGKQMEDNLIEFDLESSKIGVTYSLLSFGTSCSQFKGV